MPQYPLSEKDHLKRRSQYHFEKRKRVAPAASALDQHLDALACFVLEALLDGRYVAIAHIQFHALDAVHGEEDRMSTDGFFSSYLSRKIIE